MLALLSNQTAETLAAELGGSLKDLRTALNAMLRLVQRLEQHATFVAVIAEGRPVQIKRKSLPRADGQPRGRGGRRARPTISPCSRRRNRQTARGVGASAVKERRRGRAGPTPSATNRHIAVFASSRADAQSLPDRAGTRVIVGSGSLRLWERRRRHNYRHRGIYHWASRCSFR